MIAYTIEAAMESNLFERVVVSTEDKEIAEISKKLGAEISERSENLASDTAMVRAVAGDFLEQESAQGKEYDVISVLYATAPLRNAEDIKSVHSLIEPGVCHHANAVKEYADPPHQALKKMNDQGDLEPMWPDIVAARADSLPHFVVDNGSTYCVMTEDFRKNINFYADKMRGHMMPFWKSVDMDTIEDFELAEYFAKKYGGLS